MEIFVKIAAKIFSNFLIFLNGETDDIITVRKFSCFWFQFPAKKLSEELLPILYRIAASSLNPALL